MTWTSPKTWGSETLTSSDMNTYVRDDLLYLYGIAQGVVFSGVQVSRSTDQSISDSTETAVSFTTENLDFGGWWSSGTTVTVPAGAIPSGYTTVAVLIFCAARFATNATGRRGITALKNASSVGTWSITALPSDQTDLQLTAVTTVASGDTLTMDVYQSSGGALACKEARFTVLRYAPAT
jgi:hypothetical protein